MQGVSGDELGDESGGGGEGETSPNPSERQRARCNVANDVRVALKPTRRESWEDT